MKEQFTYSDKPWELPESIRQEYEVGHHSQPGSSKPRAICYRFRTNEIFVHCHSTSVFNKNGTRTDRWIWDTDNPGQGRWLKVGSEENK